MSNLPFIITAAAFICIISAGIYFNTRPEEPITIPAVRQQDLSSPNPADSASRAAAHPLQASLR